MDKLPKIYRSAVDGKYRHWGGSTTFMGSGMITTSDIADIEAVVVLDEVLGLARPQYNLQAMCRTIRMDKLVMNIDIATSLAGQRKVPELVEMDISKEAYTDMDFDLWKNGVHVVVSDEAGMKAAHDLLGMNISDAARDLARMRNLDISDCLDLCDNAQAADGGDATVHTWNTHTTGVSDANPWRDLLIAFTAIQADGYEPDLLVMHPDVWSGFITNDRVKSQVDAGMGKVVPAGISIPGFPTVGALMDFAVSPTTSCYVMATKAPAIVFGEGPTTSAKYRNEKAGYDAYIIRQWGQPQIIDFGEEIDAIIEITGAYGV